MDNQTLAEDFVKQANAWHRLGEYEQAIAAYRQAIALMPGSPVYAAYHFMIGDMLAEMQRYEEAVSAFRETVKAVSHYDEAWFNLGRCLLLLERADEAAPAFDRYLEIVSPRWGDETTPPVYDLELVERTSQAWYYGAQAHARLGHTGQAAQYVKQALQLRLSWQRRVQEEPLLQPYLR